MIIKKAAVLMAPSIKADNTGTVKLGTLTEITDQEWLELNKGYKDKEQGFAIFCSKDEYADFIMEEAKRLAKQLENGN